MGVWIMAQWLWPYLELVAPVGALVVLLLGVNVLDGVWFAVRHRRRFAIATATQQHQSATSGREGRPSQAA
jgi:hypothetical protein